jgi:hypothetical protein
VYRPGKPRFIAGILAGFTVALLAVSVFVLVWFQPQKLFIDDHVEAIRWKSLLLDQSDRALRRWNNDDKPHRELLVSP